MRAFKAVQSTIRITRFDDNCVVFGCDWVIASPADSAASRQLAAELREIPGVMAGEGSLGAYHVTVYYDPSQATYVSLSHDVVDIITSRRPSGDEDVVVVYSTDALSASS